MRTGRSRLRRFTLAICVVAVVSGIPASPAHAATGATTVAAGLDNPAAFTLAPDGRIFYGERLTGAVRIFNPANGTNTLLYTVPNLATFGEQGLLGIALDPNYPAEPLVYVYATRTVNGATQNQILRITDRNGVGYLSRNSVIYTAPGAVVHNGGRILFGPDGMLYAVTGDVQVLANSQNLGNTMGKVLRMSRFGLAPTDNPFPGSLIYAYGIRNSFGMAFDPVYGGLWETENGPACNDELNRVYRGLNYGWGPTQTCSTPPAAPVNTNRDGPSPVYPLAHYTPPPAVTGIAFCRACGLGSAVEGALLYGTFNTRQVRRVTLDRRRTGVAAEAVEYTHSNSILSMERGPDGAVYFSDSSGIYKLVAR